MMKEMMLRRGGRGMNLCCHLVAIDSEHPPSATSPSSIPSGDFQAFSSSKSAPIDSENLVWVDKGAEANERGATRLCRQLLTIDAVH